jgi:phosphate/sulfate permease
MKKFIFSVLGGAIFFIVSMTFLSELSGNTALIISVICFLVGGYIGGKLVKKTVEKEIDSKKTGSFWKIIIWILAIAIIIVAAIAYIGLNR